MPTTQIITGNSAIAQGVRLARVQVIAPYPITPQTSIVDEIANIIASGQLKAKFINVESEHSSLAICTGAELAGARSFTATSSMGLGYMFEGLTFLHGMRLPVVIAVANRTLGAPMGGGGPDYSDVMSARDFGFLQFYVESNQEALDTVLMAYRICEDPRVLLPAMVSLDGFYLSFSSEIVSIPDPEEVDTFLPPYQPTHALIDSDDPMALFCEPLATIHYDYQIDQVMNEVPSVIKEIEKHFFNRFGRRYGLTEEYRCEGAEAVVVTVGSMTGTAREVVDRMREEGLPVGLLKLRVLRPFPTEEVRRLASGVKALAVIDRNVSHGGGGGCGIVCLDIKSALYGGKQTPIILNLIAGLGGLDITEETIRSFLLKSLEAGRKNHVVKEVEWALPSLPTTSGILPTDNAQKLVYPGTPSCAGCTANLLFRTSVDTLGKNTCLIMPPCCISVVNSVGWPGYSPVKIPFYLTPFASTAATASGVKAGLDMRGKEHSLVLGIAGDGGTVDIGIQSLSGAADRKEPIIYVCYDNEAYMNTGMQKSGTTPLGARTTTTPVACFGEGNLLSSKSMPRIMAAHDIPYVATASVAYLEDYRRKLEKAAHVVRSRKGLAYIHAHTPCSTGWGFPSHQGIEIARLAVQTNLWPLYEIEEGVFTLTKKIEKPKPVTEYTKLQGRFRHLSAEQLESLQKYADQRIIPLLPKEENANNKLLT